jgi:hypothetical protein
VKEKRDQPCAYRGGARRGVVTDFFEMDHRNVDTAGGGKSNITAMAPAFDLGRGVMMKSMTGIRTYSKRSFGGPDNPQLYKPE